jgi:predicted nucleic acid-binding protein
MKKRIFVDTDVVLDLLAQREPFYEYAAALFTQADQQNITLFISSLSFAHLHYILMKQKSSSETRKILSRFKVLVKVLPVDDKILELALHSEFTDFEDALHYYCAIENGINLLITRNIKDYKHASIPVFTAESYCKQER